MQGPCGSSRCFYLVYTLSQKKCIMNSPDCPATQGHGHETPVGSLQGTLKTTWQNRHDLGRNGQIKVVFLGGRVYMFLLKRKSYAFMPISLEWFSLDLVCFTIESDVQAKKNMWWFFKRLSEFCRWFFLQIGKESVSTNIAVDLTLWWTYRELEINTFSIVEWCLICAISTVMATIDRRDSSVYGVVMIS